MSNDFNYDGDDQELDENGLPIYTDDDEEDGSSSADLMDMIKQAREDDDDDDSSSKKEKDNDELDPENGKYSTDEGLNEQIGNLDKQTKDLSEKHGLSDETGGRYGDKTSPTKKTSPQSKPGQATPSGGDNWFSKLTSKFGKSSGKAAEAGAKAAGAGAKAAGAATSGAGASAGGGILAALPYIAIALLVIMVIMFLISIIMSIVAFFKAETDPEYMQDNNLITNEYFYGIRVAYLDDEALVNSLQLSYKQCAVDIVSNITTDNPDIVISITLPNEFDNTTQIDQHITNMSIGIGNIVATGHSNYSSIDFATLYPQIEYFGLTSEQGNLVIDFVTEYLTNNNLISSPNGTNINTIVTNIMASDKLQYMFNRCEKVMIKDEIATEAGLRGIQQRQYIASIYMPNTNIIIESASYILSCENKDFEATSRLIEEINGTKNILREKETKDGSDIISGFSAGELNIKTFTSIDSENVNAFSEELSLFECLKLSTNYTQYFTQNPETLIYSWKPTDTSLYYLEFEASEKFIFKDFSINIKKAN